MEERIIYFDEINLHSVFEDLVKNLWVNVLTVAPSNHFNSRQYRNIGILFGAFVSMAAIIALSVMRDTVQTPKAARRKLDALRQNTGDLAGVVLNNCYSSVTSRR